MFRHQPHLINMVDHFKNYKTLMVANMKKTLERPQKKRSCLSFCKVIVETTLTYPVQASPSVDRESTQYMAQKRNND